MRKLLEFQNLHLHHHQTQKTVPITSFTAILFHARSTREITNPRVLPRPVGIFPHKKPTFPHEKETHVQRTSITYTGAGKSSIKHQPYMLLLVRNAASVIRYRLVAGSYMYKNTTTQPSVTMLNNGLEKRGLPKSLYTSLRSSYPNSSDIHAHICICIQTSPHRGILQNVNRKRIIDSDTPSRRIRQIRQSSFQLVIIVCNTAPPPPITVKSFSN